MIKLDRDALLCDLAETYQIYDLKQLPLPKVAVFSVGLKDDSRIKTKMMGLEYTVDRLIQMNISDRLALLLWSKTKDAQKGKNKPVLWSDFDSKKSKDKSEIVFESGKDFEKQRNALLKQIAGGENNGD